MTIDWWTLGLQAANVVILVWLLSHFFWRPVSAMIEQRRLAAQEALLDARDQRAQAGAALAAIEQTRAGFAQERQAILLQAHAEAEQSRQARLAQAEAEAAAAVAASHAGQQAERAAIEHAWRERAGGLAVEIAARLCAPLAGSSLQAAFLDQLVTRLGELPPADRAHVADGGATLAVVSAQPLAADQQARCRQALADALGVQAELSFATDPTLLAGVELHSPHLVVRNSWSADLRRIQMELAHGGA